MELNNILLQIANASPLLTQRELTIIPIYTLQRRAIDCLGNMVLSLDFLQFTEPQTVLLIFSILCDSIARNTDNKGVIKQVELLEGTTGVLWNLLRKWGKSFNTAVAQISPQFAAGMIKLLYMTLPVRSSSNNNNNSNLILVKTHIIGILSILAKWNLLGNEGDNIIACLNVVMDTLTSLQDLSLEEGLSVWVEGTNVFFEGFGEDDWNSIIFGQKPAGGGGNNINNNNNTTCWGGFDKIKNLKNVLIEKLKEEKMEDCPVDVVEQIDEVILNLKNYIKYKEDNV